MICAGAFETDVTLSDISSTGKGIKITGISINSLFGFAVSSGNFNGDSVADILIGAPQAASNKGEVYAVWGKNDLSMLGVPRVAFG